MDDELLRAHVDALYGLPREDFVAERDRHAAELRAAGHRAEAGVVKSQRKPTVPAWAVNQLARRSASVVAELIAAGEGLRDAQRRAISRRGGAGLRDATRSVRRLVADLREQARDLIESSGAASGAHLDDVEQTLFAAAVDPAHHETLRRGVFERAVRGTDFGGVEGLALVPPPADEDTEAAQAVDDRAAAAEAERHQAEERRAAHRRELEHRETELQRSLERQQRRVERCEATVEDLRARLAAAVTDADEQRARLAGIERELGAVRHELQAPPEGHAR